LSLRLFRQLFGPSSSSSGSMDQQHLSRLGLWLVERLSTTLFVKIDRFAMLDAQDNEDNEVNETNEDNETNNDNNAVQYHRQQQGVTTWSDTVLKYNANIRRLEEQLAQVNAQVVKYGSLFLNVQKGVAKMVLKFQKPTIQHYFSLWVQCTQSNKQVAKIALRQSANLKLMRMAMQMRVASEETTTTGTAAH